MSGLCLATWLLAPEKLSPLLLGIMVWDGACAALGAYLMGDWSGRKSGRVVAGKSDGRSISISRKGDQRRCMVVKSYEEVGFIQGFVLTLVVGETAGTGGVLFRALAFPLTEF